MKRALARALVTLLLCAAVPAFAQELPDEPEALPSGFETEAVPQPPALREPELTAAEVDRGIASWYGPGFHGRRTASGERFDMHALTAAHPTLPFGSIVRVESPDDGRSVDVRINDRGPHIKQRVIDLSRAAARALGLLDAGGGLKKVIVRLLKAPGQ